MVVVTSRRASWPRCAVRGMRGERRRRGREGMEDERKAEKSGKGRGGRRLLRHHCYQCLSLQILLATANPNPRKLFPGLRNLYTCHIGEVCTLHTRRIREVCTHSSTTIFFRLSSHRTLVLVLEPCFGPPPFISLYPLLCRARHASHAGLSPPPSHVRTLRRGQEHTAHPSLRRIPRQVWLQRVP